jgi:GntR family transcriptional regulator/MocR family aminotransferase
VFVPDQNRQQAVFDRLRQGILSGTLPAGTRLPPTRVMAEEIGVARQTVVLAYERLAAEGYVRARTGSGTYVAPDLPDATPAPASPPRVAASDLSARGARLAAIPAHATSGAINGATSGATGGVTSGVTSGTTAGTGGLEAPVGSLLAGGVPAHDMFPAQAWLRCTARVLRQMAPELAGYPPPQGLPDLRQQIAVHLAATRGLLADPDCIVVTGGTQQALRLAADLLLDHGDAVWVEDPGYIAGRGALIAAGAVPVAVPSDNEGLDVAAGVHLAPAARLALVAPSHSTPLGGALPIGRRLALLDWAARANAWVLEDDCDSEFRWEGRPLPPLATLDRTGRVIYCGTFSKTLAPAIRLGFAVVPAPLVPAFVRARTLMDRGSSSLSQAVLTEFMRQGLLAPHIRRVRTEYAARRLAVLAALRRYAPAVTPIAAPGGLHMVARLPDGCDEATAVRACRARDLAVVPLRAYFAGPPRMAGLVMGFAGTPAALAADLARRLAGAIRA